jgi:hypothetical protein
MNREKYALENINQLCTLYGYSNKECGFYLRSRIMDDYGETEDELAARRNLKLIYQSFLPVCIILALFVVFAAHEREILLSFASIIPLVFNLTVSDEAWLIPMFLIFLPASAFLFLRLKNYLYMKLPQLL